MNSMLQIMLHCRGFLLLLQAAAPSKCTASTRSSLLVICLFSFVHPIPQGRLLNVLPSTHIFDIIVLKLLLL